MTNQSLIKGSIQDISHNGDTALAILNAEVVLVCDRSGSMSEYMTDGRSKYQVEDDVISTLQRKHSGKIVVVSFSDSSCLHPDGTLPYPTGTTNMLAAFDLIESLIDVGLRAIVVSDGQPNDPPSTLHAARKFKGNMDCIFIGDEGSEGERFMQQLAREVGGRSELCDLSGGSKLLGEKLEILMLGAGR